MPLRQPSLFLSHGGGPGFFMDGTDSMFRDIDKHSEGKKFFAESLVKLLPQKPKAIIVISAHWEESQFTVGYQTSGTSLIYDYYGFPEDTYAPYLTYDVPTDLKVADKIVDLLQDAGIPCVKEDRGFDHGVFCPLKLMYPEADIPVVQLSLKSNLDMKSHMAVGRALAPLRDENILIIGSGQMTHNLRESRDLNGGNSQWAIEFVDWVYQQLSKLNVDTLNEVEEQMVNIMKRAPYASKAHPREEHLIPLLIAFGAGTMKSSSEDNRDIEESNDRKESKEQKNMKATRVFSFMAMKNMSLDTYLFE